MGSGFSSAQNSPSYTFSRKSIGSRSIEKTNQKVAYVEQLFEKRKRFSKSRLNGVAEPANTQGTPQHGLAADSHKSYVRRLLEARGEVRRYPLLDDKFCLKEEMAPTRKSSAQSQKRLYATRKKPSTSATQKKQRTPTPARRRSAKPPPNQFHYTNLSQLLPKPLKAPPVPKVGKLNTPQSETPLEATLMAGSDHSMSVLLNRGFVLRKKRAANIKKRKEMEEMNGIPSDCTANLLEENIANKNKHPQANSSQHLASEFEVRGPGESREFTIGSWIEMSLSEKEELGLDSMGNGIEWDNRTLISFDEGMMTGNSSSFKSVLENHLSEPEIFVLSYDAREKGLQSLPPISTVNTELTRDSGVDNGLPEEQELDLDFMRNRIEWDNRTLISFDEEMMTANSSSCSVLENGSEPEIKQRGHLSEARENGPPPLPPISELPENVDKTPGFSEGRDPVVNVTFTTDKSFDLGHPEQQKLNLSLMGNRFDWDNRTVISFDGEMETDSKISNSVLENQPPAFKIKKGEHLSEATATSHPEDPPPLPSISELFQTIQEASEKSSTSNVVCDFEEYRKIAESYERNARREESCNANSSSKSKISPGTNGRILQTKYKTCETNQSQSDDEFDSTYEDSTAGEWDTFSLNGDSTEVGSDSSKSLLTFDEAKQRIVEAKRRPVKKNLEDYKQLEKLGLGYIKDGVWIPTDVVASSIWKNAEKQVDPCEAKWVGKVNKSGKKIHHLK